MSTALGSALAHIRRMDVDGPSTLLILSEMLGRLPREDEGLQKILLDCVLRIEELIEPVDWKICQCSKTRPAGCPGAKTCPMRS